MTDQSRRLTLTDTSRDNVLRKTIEDELLQEKILHFLGIYDPKTDELTEDASVSKLKEGERLPIDLLAAAADTLLQEKRKAHVRGCCKMAVELAERHGLNEDVLLRAALLHDCTKALNSCRQLIILEKYAILPSENDMLAPQTMHAITGAAVAKHVFSESDEAVKAIRWHTTGHEQMTETEIALYLADMLEENRDFPGVQKMRDATREDLHLGLKLSLEHTLNYLKQTSVQIHPNTLGAYHWVMDTYSE